MNSNLKGIFSKTISEGINYIDKMVKHLPKEFTDETNSLKRSFQTLLEYLGDDNAHESKIYEHLDHLYEPVSLLYNNDVNEQQGIGGHETNRSPEIKSDSHYLPLQENLTFFKNSSSAQDNPHTQVNVSVNNEMKGMYYCLVENGDLLLNKSLDSEHAEYEIPLEKYSFSAEDKFKIKFSHNQLVIKLFFSCEDDRENWLEYFFKARQSIYSYASLRQAPFSIASLPRDTLTTTLPKEDTDFELVSQSSYQNFKRCWSVEDGLDRLSSREYTDFVDLSTLNLQSLQKDYENSISLQKGQNSPPKSAPTKKMPFQFFNRFANPLNARKVDVGYENVFKNPKLIWKKQKKKISNFDF